MNANLFDTLTFAAVGVPAILFALWKGWLAMLMVRGTKVSTEIGRWLIRLYSVVAILTFLIGAAYLLTVSDRTGWIAHDFLRTRQVMRLTIGVLYLGGIVTSFMLWRNVQALEERNAMRDAHRDAERDRIRDLERDLVRDESRDVARDVAKDILIESKDSNGTDGAA
jgi:hypothetical protein